MPYLRIQGTGLRVGWRKIGSSKQPEHLVSVRVVRKRPKQRPTFEKSTFIITLRFGENGAHREEIGPGSILGPRYPGIRHDILSMVNRKNPNSIT